MPETSYPGVTISNGGFCLYFLSLSSEFLFSSAEVQTHRLAMVLFPSTVRQNFCFSHFGWICRALWIAKNGHESPRSPEHALNYLLEKSTSSAIEMCILLGDVQKWAKDSGNKEFEGGLFFIWQNDRGFWGVLLPNYDKMQGHFSYHCREKHWHFIVQDNRFEIYYSNRCIK